MGLPLFSFDTLFLLHGVVWLSVAAVGAAMFRRFRGRSSEIRDCRGCKEHESPVSYAGELLAAKNAAEAATRAKSEFLAVMSHEIRTPLAGVMGMLELLRKLPQGPQERHYTQLAHESAAALVDILDDILDASKVEAGRLSLECIPFQLRHEISRAIECMRVRAAFKNLELSYTLSPDLPECVRGDPTRLRQIVLNLLSNAVKFTDHGLIRLVAITEGIADGQACIRISVSDTGIGMSRETTARLFTKFEQGDASTTRRFGGTGLGLSIAKHIVELMHGTINVQSEPGSGSTFTFAVKLEVASPLDLPRDTSSPARTLEPHAGRLRILCAEDEMINRVITEGFIAEMGHTVEFANDGHEALEKLAASDFDVVLMDNRMPRIDGLEATHAIRSGKKGARDPEIFIVGVTANASPVHRDTCLAAGMNGFLTKPYREADLHAALGRALEYQKSRGKLRSSAQRESVSPLWQDIPELPGMSEAELLEIMEKPTPVAASPSKVSPSPKIIQQYLEDAPRRLEQMRRALTKSDSSELGLAAHSLKNISHYVAANQLCALAAKLEEAADTKRWEDLAELLPFAEAEFNTLRPRLENELISSR